MLWKGNVTTSNEVIASYRYVPFSGCAWFPWGQLPDFFGLYFPERDGRCYVVGELFDAAGKISGRGSCEERAQLGSPPPLVGTSWRWGVFSLNLPNIEIETSSPLPEPLDHCTFIKWGVFFTETKIYFSSSEGFFKIPKLETVCWVIPRVKLEKDDFQASPS